MTAAGRRRGGARADRGRRPARSTRSPWCWPTRPAPRPTRATRRWPRARRPARCTAYRSRSRRRSTSRARHHLRRRRQLDAGRRRRRGRTPAPRRRRGRRSARRTMPEFGALPVHRVGLPRDHPQPVGPGPHARRLQRRYGGRGGRGMVPVGMGGDGGGSIRIPSACCGLFGLKPQRGRVTTAPMAHLWWALGTAGPLTRSVLDSAHRLRRRSAATSTGDLFRAGDPALVRRGGAARARTAADRLVGQAGDPRRPPGPGRTCGRSRTPPGCSPTSATTCARSTRATPTRRRRSCRSSSPASAPRRTRWSTTSGSSGAPARPTGWAPG